MHIVKTKIWVNESLFSLIIWVKAKCYSQNQLPDTNINYMPMNAISITEYISQQILMQFDAQ